MEESLTYDDILQSLNVRLRQGKLESLAPKMAPKMAPKVSPPNNTHTIYPTNPHLQNSYIYNKYFKKEMQAQTQEELEPAEPMTREQYRQYILQQRHQAILERERIKQIKSTRMLFSNGNNTDIVIKTQNTGGLNRMFRFPRS